MSFCVLELDFEVLQSIRSLPPFHGARWAAVFRHVCHAAGLDIDSLILGIMPWQQGIQPLQQGHILGVRLLLDARLLDARQGDNVRVLLQALQYKAQGEGEFLLGRTLRLAHAYCGLSGKDAHKEALLPISMEHVFAKARTLTQCKHWSMRFAVPMRLARPEGQRHAGKYCDQTFFHENPHALARIAEKIRFLPWAYQAQESWPTLAQSTLTWHDMRYNKERGMALGGVTGELIFTSPPHPSLALSLAFGEFSGVGKNPRFGLGYYCLSK